MSPNPCNIDWTYLIVKKQQQQQQQQQQNSMSLEDRYAEKLQREGKIGDAPDHISLCTLMKF